MDGKLSIVVPVYNAERYLEDCILSILNQSYKNIEIILINDGSTDNSENICSGLVKKYKNVKLISTENKGVSHARNIGMKNATGKYLAFVDSDDKVEKNIYVNMIKDMKINSMPIIGYKYVDEDNKILGEKKPYDFDGIFKKQDFFIFCENFIMNSPVNKIFYLDIIKSHGLKFDEKLSLGEDLIFILSYIKYIDLFTIINETPYRYLTSNIDSLSQKYRPDLLNIQIKIIESTYKTFIDNNIDFYKYKKRFYTRSLELILQAINNTMNQNNPMTLKDKFKYNNKVIKSQGFKDLLYFSDLSQLNIFTIIGFKIGSYRFVYYTNKLINKIRWRRK